MSTPAPRLPFPGTTYFDDPSALGATGTDTPPPMDQPEAVFDWVLQKITEGERINQQDPSYHRSDAIIADLMGDQDTGRHRDDRHRVVVNQTRRSINTHASMLTDLRALWEYRTHNEQFKTHAAAYNNALLTWWVQTSADLELADACRYSAAIGSSDILFEWDPHFKGGEMRLVARDWRDTLPIGPERSNSVQDWEGVIFREPHGPAKLRALWPGRFDRATGSSGRFAGVFTRVRQVIRPEGQPSTLSGLGAKDPNARYQAVAAQPELVLYRTFVRDHAINMSDKPRLMGLPGRNWSYYVAPGKPLYPRGRCILIVDGDPNHRPVYDGPNPYWHRRWPFTRFSMQRWPWLFVGMPLANDLRQLQRTLNSTINDFLQVFSQWVNRGSVWGKNMPESMFQRFDPTKPNWKIKMNSLIGTGFTMQDGPQLPPWSFEFLMMLFQKYDELSGVANLTQLLQLRQMPSEKTIEKYLEAMTPEIRMEARQIEIVMRDIADMFLPTMAQFYSRSKRMMKLGSIGQVLEDSDYDPDTIVPAMAPGTAGYIPELDHRLPRDERAEWYLKQFAFYAAPGSILALHAMERQMMYLQLSRQGYVDFWTLLEMMEIPNVGSPPPVLLPKLDLTPEQMKAMPTDPNTGQPQLPMELRIPITIAERLQAQSQLGIGQTVSPVGRKATGAEAPQVEQNSDGSTTVSESG